MTTVNDKILLTLGDLGYGAEKDARILDFGCGNGASVRDLRERGFEAYGCDLKFKNGPFVQDLSARGMIRLIDTSPYRLPFEDDFFDVVYSQQVFEHVQNYRETLSEIHRVMKPGGAGLHIFPSRYRPIESHFHVPLASIIKNYRYLLFWARLGIRNRNQRDMSPEEVAEYNYTALNERTNYLSRKEIASFMGEFFDRFGFCELAAARHSRLRRIHPLLRLIPFSSRLLSAFQTRVIFLRK
jgi:SAM-dependent methyltransferase